MFHTSCYVVLVANIGTLVTPDDGGAHGFTEIRVFAKSLIDTRPKRRFTKVQNRREIPWNIAGANLIGCYLPLPMRQVAVNGGCQRNFLREKRAYLRIIFAVYSV